MHELDAGDPDPTIVTLSRELLRRVAVAGREDAVAVGLAPLGDARPRAGRDEGDVEVDLLGSVDRVDLDGVRCHEARRAGDHAHALALQQPARPRVQVRLDPLDARRQRFGVDRRRRLLETHSRRAAQEAHRPTGGDHRLRRDAVEEVRGTADELTLDDGHLGAEASGERRRRVARRSAADDEESGGHAVKAMPTRSVEFGVGGREPC